MCFWSLLWGWQKDVNWRLRICFVSRSDTPTRTIATWAETFLLLVCVVKVAELWDRLTWLRGRSFGLLRTTSWTLTQVGLEVSKVWQPSARWQTAGGDLIPRWSARRLKTVDPLKGNGLGKKVRIRRFGLKCHSLSLTFYNVITFRGDVVPYYRAWCSISRTLTICRQWSRWLTFIAVVGGYRNQNNTKTTHFFLVGLADHAQRLDACSTKLNKTGKRTGCPRNRVSSQKGDVNRVRKKCTSPSQICASSHASLVARKQCLVSIY